jgi:hypothetical protein
VNQVRPKQPRLRLDLALYEQLRNQVLHRDGGDGSRAALGPTSKSTTKNSAATPATIQSLITLCTPCHDCASRMGKLIISAKDALGLPFRETETFE